MIEAALFDADDWRRDCFEFRIGIEGEAAATAARNRTSADIERLREAMDRLIVARREARLGLEEDFAFHMAVARASGNDYFSSVLDSLKDRIFSGMLLARTATGLNIREKLAAIDEQHGQVYRFILLGDEEGARRHMRSHLMRCKKSTAHWDSFVH